MSYSRQQYVYAGGSRVFPVNFSLGYLDRADVTVYVEGELDGAGNQVNRAFTWNNSGEVLVTDPIPSGRTVVVQRTVDKDALEIGLTDTGEVTRTTLARGFTHMMMSIHEILDGRIEGFSGRLLAVIGEIRDSAVSALNAAVSAASSANSSKTAAAASAAAALSEKNGAIAARNAAADHASSAANSADTASGHVTDAQFYADIASVASAEFDFPAFVTYAAAEVSTVAPGVQMVFVAGRLYRKDPAGTALETADGAKWSPVGELDVRFFGATENNAAVNRSAFQAAFNFSAATKTRLRINGKFNVSGTLNVPSGARIYSDGGELLECTLRLVGAPTGGAAITADVAAGSITIPIHDGEVFQMGDYVRLVSRSNAQKPGAGEYMLGDRADAAPEVYLSEFSRVDKVTGNTITLNTATLFPYSTTDSSSDRTFAEVTKVGLVDDVVIDGLVVRRTSENVTDLPLYMEWCGPDVRITNCTFDCSAASYIYARPVFAMFCYGTKIRDCSFFGIKNMVLSGSQGNCEVRACQDMLFSGCNTAGGNQGIDITVGGPSPYGGPSIGNVIDGCVFRGTYTDCVTTHWGCLNNTISNCTIYATRGNGVRIRSKGDVVTGNRIYGSGEGYGVYVSNIPFLGIRIHNNHIQNFRSGICVQVLFEASYTPAEWPFGHLGMSITRNVVISSRNDARGIWFNTNGQVSSRHISTVVADNILRCGDAYTGTRGIQISPYVHGVHVRGNTIQGYAAGVHVFRNVVECIFSDNTFMDCALTGFRGESASILQVEDTATLGARANAGIAVQRNYFLNAPLPLSIPADFLGVVPHSL